MYLSDSASTQARPMSWNQSEARMLVSDWLQLTGLGCVVADNKLSSLNIALA